MTIIILQTIPKYLMVIFIGKMRVYTFVIDFYIGTTLLHFYLIYVQTLIYASNI